MERVQTMGDKFNEYRKYLQAHFKDMNFEIKDWNFSVGKQEKEYLITFGCKVAISSKAKNAEAKAKV
jgi:hypothetical protein